MQVALAGGAYTARGLVANAQRCVNLYPEINPSDSLFPTTHYPTPGLTRLATSSGICRCLYMASNGKLYGVYGSTVYYITAGWAFEEIGQVGGGSSIVSMTDNRLVIVVVDGTANGWTIDMASGAYRQITDPAFYGADRADYLDTFFVFNRPGTNQLYISPSNWDGVIAFDPLDIAAKVGGSDGLTTLVVMHREIWLLGPRTTEVWYNSGAADFTFERLPGVFVEHGIGAIYSLAKADISIFFLGLDVDGARIVFEGTDYTARRISTHALEAALSGYTNVADAVGFTYQQQGHTFYQLTFPSAGKTWVYDMATKLWHERESNYGRHRANCAAFAYDTNVVGDYTNGRLYQYDLGAFTDDGSAIIRRRGFPHMAKDGKRLLYSQFIADMQVGNTPGTTPETEPQVFLRWSDTAGQDWGNPIDLGVGAAGEYLRSMQARQLGMARDRVFELFWSMGYFTALNGAWIDVSVAGT